MDGRMCESASQSQQKIYVASFEENPLKVRVDYFVSLNSLPNQKYPKQHERSALVLGTWVWKHGKKLSQ